MPRYAPLKTWVDVSRSSNLKAVWYDAETEILKITFKARKRKDGSIIPERTYGYSGVPIRVYVGLLDADSRGTYHAKHIKWAYPFMQL